MCYFDDLDMKTIWNVQTYLKQLWPQYSGLVKFTNNLRGLTHVCPDMFSRNLAQIGSCPTEREKMFSDVNYVLQQVGLHGFIKISGKAGTSRFGQSSKTVPWIEWLEPYDLVVSVEKFA